MEEVLDALTALLLGVAYVLAALSVARCVQLAG